MAKVWRRWFVAAAAVEMLAIAACASSAPAPVLTPRAETATARTVAELPAVLTGQGELRCDISDRKNGRQVLVIEEGGGLEFDAVVSPMIDGTVKTDGPEKGGVYRFTSHLAQPAKGSLPGVGQVDLDELETKVVVEMTRYRQPDGPGTALSFDSDNMRRRGIYVEFAGKAHASNGDRFSFRVNLGAPTAGSGRVVPRNAAHESEMAAKVVSIRAPVNTVVVTTRIERDR